jgi:hypothetical protein
VHSRNRFSTATQANFGELQRHTCGFSSNRFVFQRILADLSGRLTLRPPVNRKVVGSSPTSGATVLNTNS